MKLYYTVYDHINMLISDVHADGPPPPPPPPP